LILFLHLFVAKDTLAEATIANRLKNKGSASGLTLAHLRNLMSSKRPPKPPSITFRCSDEEKEFYAEEARHHDQSLSAFMHYSAQKKILDSYIEEYPELAEILLKRTMEWLSTHEQKTEPLLLKLISPTWKALDWMAHELNISSEECLKRAIRLRTNFSAFEEVNLQLLKVLTHGTYVLGGGLQAQATSPKETLIIARKISLGRRELRKALRNIQRLGHTLTEYASDSIYLLHNLIRLSQDNPLGYQMLIAKHFGGADPLKELNS
jgi:hypothetical protein